MTQASEILVVEPGPIGDTRAMVAGVGLSTVAIATFLLMPQFVEAVVVDLR